MNINSDNVKPFLRYATKMSIAIRGLRNMFALSQGQLAQKAEVSRPTINRLESLKSERGFRAETLDSLLKVFLEMGVEISWNEQELVIKIPNTALLEAEQSILASATPSRAHENWKKGTAKRQDNPESIINDFFYSDLSMDRKLTEDDKHFLINVLIAVDREKGSDSRWSLEAVMECYHSTLESSGCKPQITGEDVALIVKKYIDWRDSMLVKKGES